MLLLGLGPVGPRRRAPAGVARRRRCSSSSRTRSASPRRGTSGLGFEAVSTSRTGWRAATSSSTPRRRPTSSTPPTCAPETIAAVPGMPSAFTAAAQEALGVRHIHEPLAIGVAVMAARALL